MIGGRDSRHEDTGASLSLRVLVGLHPDDSLPTIAGCVDEGTWEVETREDTERRWQACKKDFGMVAEEYEWREVRVELPAADVLRYFDRPLVKGSVPE